MPLLVTGPVKFPIRVVAVTIPVTLIPLLVTGPVKFPIRVVAVTIPVTLIPLETIAGAINELIVPIPLTYRNGDEISFAAPAVAKLLQVVPLNPWN